MYTVYNQAQVEFKYQEEIGQDGKNSRAFIAHDRNLDALLVIKEIPIGLIENKDGFLEESRLLYKASHANVVQIQYACTCDKNIYIALPYYKNGSIKDLMRERYLTVREVLRFSIQICSGLHNIHSKGLIHFDIKPDNILLSERMEALISDFGLAKAMGLDKTAVPNQFYSKHLAPEFFGKEDLTSQYDIYQLGLTMYRLIFGDNEFYSQIGKFQSPDEFADAILNEKFPAEFSLEHIPQKLITIIKKCLKVDLEERYASPLEVANDLSSIDDKTLDWQYRVENGTREWHKVTPTHEYMLTIENGVATAKKKTTSGKWSMIKDSCGTLGLAQIKGFLRRY